MLQPNKKSIHFFDLDGSLWSVDSRAWIIDKEQPQTPIIILNSFEINKILNGLYIKDELKIDYSGKQYYISKDIFKRINNKKKLPIERLGLSWTEFHDKKHLENTQFKLLFKNIEHLSNEDVYISLLTARADRKKHSQLLNSLRVRLKDIGLNIYKIYFVSKFFQERNNSEIALNKTYVLLEHLIGLKIEDGKFIPILQDWFSDIHFYDDEFLNIDYVNDIQTVFDRLLKNTEDDVFNMILEKVKNYNLNITTNLISNNDVNRFIKKTITLKEPIKFQVKLSERYLMKYKDFLMEKSN